MKNDDTKMIVGRAVNAKTNPPGKIFDIAVWSARPPKTNWEPALVNSRNRLTPAPITVKNS